MNARIHAKRVETPTYGRPLETEIDSEVSHSAFAPNLDRVLEHVGKMLEAEFNDPDRFFAEEVCGFPLRARISGEYYLSSLRYDGDDQTCELWVLIHCLGDEGRQWGDAEPNFDYVSMEMIAYLDMASGQVSYEESFTNAAL